MKTIIFILLLALLLPAAARAQYVFQGEIEYERKVNILRRIEKNEWMQQFKDKLPHFMLNYFNLTFTTHHSRYAPGREVDNTQAGWAAPPGAENEVYQDFDSHTVTAGKQIYEQRFLVQDSAQRFSWRITDELRTIAGYTCRKAVTRICDSVYVVAFYTDDIAVSSGPEQFGGLPGMILELAVPRLFSTWTATKVTLTPVKESDAGIIPAKGKKVTQAELAKTLQSSLKDWGKDEQSINVWWGML